MSRALDPETAALLKKGNPQAAYKTISSVLTSPSDGLLEIEILGKGPFFEEGQYVLQDGHSVGISKLGLVQAFMVARQKLRDHLDATRPQTDDEILAATAVILLFDPEYLTAANTRKRLLQAQISNHEAAAQSSLESEKRFLDSLLTSRLHRHTKSPTLWSHRRWVVRMFVSSGCQPVDVLEDITKVVFVAGQRHPRNYYAWCHARFLMTSLDGGRIPPGVLVAMREWCFQHHTDISGWSFLYFLLDRYYLRDGDRTFAEVLDLVYGLRLANESVWVFLRTVAASGLVGEEQYPRFLAVQEAVLKTSKTPADQKVLRAAVDWCETYRRQDGTRLRGA